MAVTLTYEPLLSRVKIVATGLGISPVAIVERSVDQVRWTTVRGGSAAPVVGTQLPAPLYDYEFTFGVLNYYRVTPVPAGLHVPAATTGNAFTPDTAVLDIVGDITLTIDFSMDDWTPTVPVVVGGKWTTTTSLSYAMFIDAAGRPGLWWTTNGSSALFAVANAALPVVNGQRAAVRVAFDVNNGAGGNTATFSYSLDGGAVYTQLGTPIVTAGVTSIFSGSASLTVGSSTAYLWSGVVYALEVRSGIAGAGTVVANPQFTAQGYLASSFVDTAGRTWTVNVPAGIQTGQTSSVTPGGVAACGNEVWLKSIARPFLNRTADVINQDAIKITRPARVGVFDVVGRSNPVTVSDVRKSRRWTMTVRTETVVDAEGMDLLLASGDVLLIQTPPNSSTPAGYVAIGDAERSAHPLRPNRVTWTLPCVEVAAPGPDVVGTAVTWQTVIDAYATWADVMAAHATWASLLTLIGSPTEVLIP